MSSKTLFAEGLHNATRRSYPSRFYSVRRPNRLTTSLSRAGPRRLPRWPNASCQLAVGWWERERLAVKSQGLVLITRTSPSNPIPSSTLPSLHTNALLTDSALTVHANPSHSHQCPSLPIQPIPFNPCPAYPILSSQSFSTNAFPSNPCLPIHALPSLGNPKPSNPNQPVLSGAYLSDLSRPIPSFAASPAHSNDNLTPPVLSCALQPFPLVPVHFSRLQSHTALSHPQRSIPIQPLSAYPFLCVAVHASAAAPIIAHPIEARTRLCNPIRFGLYLRSSPCP